MSKIVNEKTLDLFLADDFVCRFALVQFGPDDKYDNVTLRKNLTDIILRASGLVTRVISITGNEETSTGLTVSEAYHEPDFEYLFAETDTPMGNQVDIPILTRSYSQDNPVDLKYLALFHKMMRRDLFSSRFIYDCLLKKKLVNLSSYRVCKSLFKNYDAQELFLLNPNEENGWDSLVYKLPSEAAEEEEDLEPTATSPPKRSKNEKINQNLSATKKITKNCNTNDLRLLSIIEEVHINDLNKGNEKEEQVKKVSLPIKNNINEPDLASKSSSPQKLVEPKRSSPRRKVTFTSPTTTTIISKDESKSHRHKSILPGKKTLLNRKRNIGGPIVNVSLNESETSTSDNELSDLDANFSVDKAPEETETSQKKKRTFRRDETSPPPPEVQQNTSNQHPPLSPSRDNNQPNVDYVIAGPSSNRTGGNAGQVQHQRTGRGPYQVFTYQESQALVDYICKNKFHLDVRGNTLWKKIDNSKNDPLPNRSWQSKRENFVKKILKNLQNYRMNERDRDIFKTLQVKERNR